MNNKLELYLIDVISNKKTGFTAVFLRTLLSMLSQIYTAAVKIRTFLYKNSFLRSRRLGCLVISIGNLTVGGTGKTPVVEMFAKALIKGGRKIAILSRGYQHGRARNKSRPQVRVVSDGKKILLNVNASGDEPFMLAKNVPQAVVLAGKDRVHSARFAITKYGADTIILDDGYQYLDLARQINIVLIDATNPFGIQYLLPRGTLREPISNLDRATMFFLTKAEGMDLYALKKKLNRINPKAEIIECTHTPKYLNDVYSRTKRDIKWLAGRKIACVSGIAKPQGFENTLKGLGAVLVGFYRFSDHYMYTKRELEELEKYALGQDAEALITTEKDAVRFPLIAHPKDFPIYYLRVEIEILSGVKDFYDRIGQMCY